MHDRFVRLLDLAGRRTLGGAMVLSALWIVALVVMILAWITMLYWLPLGFVYVMAAVDHAAGKVAAGIVALFAAWAVGGGLFYLGNRADRTPADQGTTPP